MAYTHLQSKLVKGGSAVACALAVSLAIAGSAVAQDKKAPAAKAPAAAPAAPAAKDAAAAPAGSKSAWVKLCEKAQIPSKDKDGKDVKKEKNICLTHHERLDGNTGMVLVSAAIREIEGNRQADLMVMVPLGMALPPGVRAAVYTKELWEKAAKNEKIDEKLLKPLDLKYSLCHPAGCTAEVEATTELIDADEGRRRSDGSGHERRRRSRSASRFRSTASSRPIAGKPVDNAEYAKARQQLMGQIAQRQRRAR